MKTGMKSGKYYIGDPCYLFDASWRKLLEENSYFDNDLDEQQINGIKVAIGHTKYGDGLYEDSSERKYCVDAGLIGVVPVELLSLDGKQTEESINSDVTIGHIVEFSEDFDVNINDGLFSFGDIVINTEESDEPEDDENIYDDEEEDEEEEPLFELEKETTVSDKPSVVLAGEDSNVFNLMGICDKALRRAGTPDKAKEMSERVFNSGSYDEAIAIMSEYCNVQ
jgi:hypothetical protein